MRKQGLPHVTQDHVIKYVASGENLSVMINTVDKSREQIDTR
jgi:hypothetical protein